MSTPLWPCNLRVALVACSQDRAEYARRDHEEFFRCRVPRYITPSTARYVRGLSFDAVWVQDEEAWTPELQQSLLPTMIVSDRNVNPRVWVHP